MAARRFACAAALLLTALLAACGSPRRGEPVVGPIVLSAAGERGRQTFMAVCHQCHPGGEAGLAPSLNDKALPGFVIRYQVRHGLGAMPAFDANRISGGALSDVVAYLRELRTAGHP